MAFFKKRFYGLYSKGFGEEEEVCQSVPSGTGAVLPISSDIIFSEGVTPIQAVASLTTQEASFLSKIPYWLWMVVIGGGFLFLGGRKTKSKRKRSF